MSISRPVLLVDPDRHTLAIMASSLRESGYEPTVTDEFEEAIALHDPGRVR